MGRERSSAPIWKENPVMFASVLEPGGCCPWKKGRDQSNREGRPPARDPKSRKENGSVQALSYVRRKLFFSWEMEDSFPARQHQTQMFSTSSLHSLAALRTWYLGQQPGRTALFERCYILFSLRSHRPINYFYDLTNTI